MRRVILIAFSTLVMLILVVGAAFALEIDFRIVGFGEQNCTNGSNSLTSSSADPFDVQACVTDGGSPVSGASITAVVTHADGSTEEIALETGNDGSVTYTVTPVAAGTTTVEMCDGGNCDFGVLTFKSDGPPTPPAVASYFGPTTDMGPSQPILDGSDDFDDPYTGGPAEAGVADPRMDITSYRYLGNEGGTAMWEITTLGNACELYDDPTTPWWQVTVFVSTRDDQHYNVTYRTNAGVDPYANAYSDGVNLRSTVMLPSCMDNVITLSATGVDVPVGSQMQALTWYSLDPLSSGYQDFADGFPTAVVPDPASTPTPTDGETTGSTDAPTGTPEPISSGGSFPIWIPIVVFGVAIGGYLMYRSTRSDGTVALTTGQADVTDADLEQYRDGDLGSYTDAYAGAAAGSVAADLGSDLDSGWAALLGIEDEIQEKYLGDFKRLLTEVAEGYKAYHEAISMYKEKFVKIASASTDLQGYLQRWADVKDVAWYQDLAFGIITLVWGVGNLGTKVVKWMGRPKVAKDAAEAAGTVLGSANELATADTVIAQGATVIDAGRDLNRNLLIDEWLNEIGYTWEEWIKLHKFDTVAADLALRNAVGLARGWHGITDNAAGVINRLLVNGRSAVAGKGGSISPTDIAQLREWASSPGFWDGFLTTAGHLDEFELCLFYSVDDMKFLKALLECEGDLGSLAPLLGPAQSVALEIAAETIDDIPSLAGLAADGARVAVNVGDTASDLSGIGDASQLSAGLDLGSYTNQFGGWAQYFDEGAGVAGLGKFVLWNLWGMFSSPYEWFYGIIMTGEAMDRYTEFLEVSRDDLTSMGAALKGATDSLRGMAGAIDRADLDDPTSSLGGASADRLRSLVADMDDHLSNAPDSWKEAHGTDVESRKAHIQQKITDIERILGSLQSQLGRLQQMGDMFDSLLRNPDGSLRDVVDLWNPEILVKLAAGDLALRGIIGSSLQGASTALPPSADPDNPQTSPVPPDPFAADNNPFAEFDAQSDAEYEAEWRGELDDVFTDGVASEE